jgi:hypothetical protein
MIIGEFLKKNDRFGPQVGFHFGTYLGKEDRRSTSH